MGAETVRGVSEMLVRFYWDEAGAFIASDDPEFQRLFDELCRDFGSPERIRVGPRENECAEYTHSRDVVQPGCAVSGESGFF